MAITDAHSRELERRRLDTVYTQQQAAYKDLLRRIAALEDQRDTLHTEMQRTLRDLRAASPWHSPIDITAQGGIDD